MPKFNYVLDDRWLRTSTEIKNYREELAKQQDNKCAVTGSELKRPCLDHDHLTGKCRGVLESNVNMFEGRLYKQYKKYLSACGLSYPDFLIALGTYLNDCSKNTGQPLHHKTAEDRHKSLQSSTKANAIKRLKMDCGVRVSGHHHSKADVIDLYMETFIRNLENAK